jgi:hypothetical protein
MGLAFWPPVSTSAFSLQPSAFALSALLTIYYIVAMVKTAINSRFGRWHRIKKWAVQNLMCDPRPPAGKN